MSEDIIQIQEPNYGPGNVLRAKREEYEWSVEAVAEALNLSSSAVRAIEADRYDDLPGATYVIGYWRSYARLLGIDIEDTIEANKRNLNIIVPESVGLDVSRAYKHKKSGSMGGWLIVLALLAGGAYYAWKQQFFGWFDVVMDTNQQQAVSVASNGVERAGSDSVEPTGENNVLRPLASSTEVATLKIEQQPEIKVDTLEKPKIEVATTMSGLPQNSGLVLEKIPAQVQLSSEGSENSTVVVKPSQSQISVSGVENATELSAHETEQNTQPENENQIASGEGSIIVFNLTMDSWLDVRDKTNKRLIYETKTAGSEVKLLGDPPFYVYIGTPAGVKLKYKGKEVPFKTHKSGLFARFKLGDTLESL